MNVGHNITSEHDMKMGSTLLFGCRSQKNYLGMLNCYIIQARNRAQLRKKAMELGRTEASHFYSAGDESCTFIGLYDVYPVVGSLRTGAILGHSSYWSHKTQAAAERHISLDRQLLTTVKIDQQSTRPREYLFRAIYLLSSASIPKEERRTIEAWLLITTDRVENNRSNSPKRSPQKEQRSVDF
jgi:hypothetical protein